ncbi:MAG: hypothetical protein PHG96_04340 [Kiritimatiellae bacterium]|nr:hypothetical protein [Kiritimatiellia bacterium]MDD4026439.1 hypothetical protein [Kiritimatiellia bacterium]
MVGRTPQAVGFEIARQGSVGRSPEKLMADRTHMQAQKDEIDERRHMETAGMTRAEATLFPELKPS